MKNRNVQYHNSIIEAAEQLYKTFKEVAKILHRENSLDVSHEEYLILESIYLNPGIVQSDIAKNILMKRSYLCKFLAELEEKGYIYRENTIRGKRQIVFKNFITPEGKKIYEKVQNVYIENAKSIATDYEFEELERAALIMLEVTEKAKNVFNIKL